MNADLQAVRAEKIFCLDGKLPIADGVLVFKRHSRRIVLLGEWKSLKKECVLPDEIIDLGTAWIVPGVFNCHTHLELCGCVAPPPQADFCSWAKELVKSPKIFSSAVVQENCQKLERTGTAFVADFCAGKVDDIVSILQKLRLDFLLFREYLGWKNLKERPLRADVSCAVHSLYGVSPQAAVTLHARARQAKMPFALHLGESEAEEQFFQTGQGELAEMLVGKLIPQNMPIFGCSSLQLAQRLGVLDSQTLLVHCTHIRENELDILKQYGSFPCLCPRSNVYTGSKKSPAKMLLDAHIPFCLGTDGLASNADLNVWNEALFLHRLFRLSLRQIFDMLICFPARFFGVEDRLGSFAVGKKAIFSIVPEELML